MAISEDKDKLYLPLSAKADSDSVDSISNGDNRMSGGKGGISKFKFFILVRLHTCSVKMVKVFWL